MKAIVGIDTDGLYRSAIRLLGRLNCQNMEAELVHVDEPVYTYGGGTYPFVVTYTPEVGQARRQVADKLLADAEHAATSAGLKADVHYEVGPVTGTLLRMAEEAHADVVAVGSTKKSKYGSFFLGSVGRGLTIGSPRSVLIAKGEPAATGPLKAVFATDYSEYGEECLRQLVRMHPSGIEKLILVTAVDSLGKSGTVADTLEKEATKRTEEIACRAQKTVDHLNQMGLAAEYRIVEGDVHSVIDATMRDSGADLLMMGAHGHGMLDRMIVGSDSLQEAIGSPHSLLILRVPKPQ